ncbi:MAG: hypothetical protein H0T76_23245 [Nannocystis sp.]|nr:hypothetical protein [Nannocystis sp.]MBA3549401.1 hypothetical protein [Nannocystis sp.]
MTRLLITVSLLLAACRHDLDAARAPLLRELCEGYCPDRVACVADGFFGGEVDTCVERCVGEERFLEDNACGEASFATLECLAALECAELPAAVQAAASSDESVGCRAELLEEQRVCDFRPRY